MRDGRPAWSAVAWVPLYIGAAELGVLREPPSGQGVWSPTLTLFTTSFTPFVSRARRSASDRCCSFFTRPVRYTMPSSVLTPTLSAATSGSAMYFDLIFVVISVSLSCVLAG